MHQAHSHLTVLQAMEIKLGGGWERKMPGYHWGVVRVRPVQVLIVCRDVSVMSHYTSTIWVEQEVTLF